MVGTPIGQSGQNAAQAVEMEPGCVSETAQTPSQWEEVQTATILDQQKNLKRAIFLLVMTVSKRHPCVSLVSYFDKPWQEGVLEVKGPLVFA